ncbi:MAG: hypothetical protein EA377_05975 [Phycisphaerales bacterium]|nr:MAG: hypothetical protein EA377_05975 [Phycisphaerales bacterium]
MANRPDRRCDPFGPPELPTEVYCLHCECVYDSWQIEWVEDKSDSQCAGHWGCPTPGCEGWGFGFDILPTDPDYVDEDGERMYCFDDECDEFEEEDVDAEDVCTEGEEDDHDEGEDSRNGGGGREIGAPYAMGEVEGDARCQSPDGGADATDDDHHTEPPSLTFGGRLAFLNLDPMERRPDPNSDQEPPPEFSDEDDEVLPW